MPGTGPFNAYIDIPTFLAEPVGQAMAGLLGVNTVTTQAVVAGAATLKVQSSDGVQPNQKIYILDGPNSEIAFAHASTPAPDETTITLTGNLQFAHGANVSVSSGGEDGDLAQFILSASGWVENFCQQGTLADRGMFSGIRTERIAMPSMRAHLDPDYMLEVMPYNSPITAVSEVMLESYPGSGVALNVANVIIDPVGQVFYLPVIQSSAVPGGPSLAAALGRGDAIWCKVTYTAGFAWPNDMPWDFMKAVILVTQEFIGMQQNPTGAAQIREGNTQVMQRLPGGRGRESSADSIFMAQAKAILEQYRMNFA